MRHFSHINQNVGMSLPTTLNTNEVKNAAGTEVEFSSYDQSGRTRTFANSSESPAEPHRLSVSHQDIGSGLTKRRRSVVRVDYSKPGDINAETIVKHSAYLVVDTPVGNVNNYDDTKDALANLLSFCATTGAGTTVLFDCSGNGAAALVNGTL